MCVSHSEPHGLTWHIFSCVCVCLAEFRRYVPDTSKVRQKMLYASSKKDLLLKLGASLFTEDDFYVGEASDLTYDGFSHSLRKATEAERAELLTEAEAAVQAEAEESTASPARGGGGAVPFAFDDEVKGALEAFAAGDRNAVEIKIHPKKEICQLGALDGSTAKGDLEAGIVPEEPRFYLLNYDGRKTFVYCCPENSKVRTMHRSVECLRRALMLCVVLRMRHSRFAAECSTPRAEPQSSRMPTKLGFPLTRSVLLGCLPADRPCVVAPFIAHRRCSAAMLAVDRDAGAAGNQRMP